jgi:hypothetical protein
VTDARQFYIGSMRALENPHLTDGDQVVYDAICSHANGNGLCWPSVATLARVTRGRTERAIRKSLRVLEEQGLIRTWKEGSFNRYQVIRDASDEVIAAAIKDPTGQRNVGSGVVSIDPESRHRNGGSGGEGAEPKVRTGTVVPVEGNVGSGETGTWVPGEQVQEQGTDLTAVDAREEASMGEGNPTGPNGDTAGDSAMTPLLDLARALAIAVNQALRDNPATQAHASLYPLAAGSAMTPLKDWLDEGIPFDVIREACAKAASRFSPAQKGDHISRFNYFAPVVRSAWGKHQANADVDAAQKAPAAPAKKLRRLA